MFKTKTRYRYDKPVKKTRWALRLLSVVCSALLIGAGIYLLFLVQAPEVKPLTVQQQEVFKPEEIGDKRLIIPKIAVNIEVNSGDLSVLKRGGWHRFPERGDPANGGNFIVSAHRFIITPSAKQTKEQSYFYNIDKLSVGDEILVDWQHKRHKYQVSEIKTVVPTQTEIEAASTETKLTLYTCTLGGSKDGRVVIIAKPVS